MIFHRCLKQDFGIGAPRIAVLSLNPHAGDGGLLGMEEQEIIIPAMKEMEEKGIICYGPYAADGFMGSAIILTLTESLLCIMIRDWLRSKPWLWKTV